MFLSRPLAQSTRRPVRNRRSGHPAERWLAEKHEQGNMDGRLCLESVQCGKGYVEISESYIFFSCALHIFRLY